MSIKEEYHGHRPLEPFDPGSKFLGTKIGTDKVELCFLLGIGAMPDEDDPERLWAFRGKSLEQILKLISWYLSILFLSNLQDLHSRFIGMLAPAIRGSLELCAKLVTSPGPGHQQQRRWWLGGK